MNSKAADGDFLLFSSPLYPNGDCLLKRTLCPFLSTPTQTVHDSKALNKSIVCQRHPQMEYEFSHGECSLEAEANVTP